jgi:hypothetical protein
MTPATLTDARDQDWILAIAASLGMNSGYSVPIVPTKEAFDTLFASIRAGHAAGQAASSVPREPPVLTDEPCGQDNDPINWDIGYFGERKQGRMSILKSGALRLEWVGSVVIVPDFKTLVDRAGYAAAQRAVPREPFFTLTLTPEEILGLVEFSGADEADASEITINYLYEHEGGPGWYAHISEYPEEGSIPVHLPYDDHNDDAATQQREGT